MIDCNSNSNSNSTNNGRRRRRHHRLTLMTLTDRWCLYGLIVAILSMLCVLIPTSVLGFSSINSSHTRRIGSVKRRTIQSNPKRHKRLQHRLYTSYQGRFSSNDYNQASQQQQAQVEVEEIELTLYEVLGIPSSATPKEIKQTYFQLAKMLHPDAIRSNGDDHVIAGRLTAKNIEFSDIVNAYKVLSNPKTRKKYDREMKAQQFAKNVNDISSNVVDTVAPQISNLMDNFAVPFLRRTTATTVAAATKFADVSAKNQKSKKKKKKKNKGIKTNNNSNDVNNYDANSNYAPPAATASSAQTTTTDDEIEEVMDEATQWRIAIEEAVMAARRAGKMVDGMEILEKYDRLQERAQTSENAAFEIKQELDCTRQRRIDMMVGIPDAVLSSSEAMEFLSHHGLLDESSYLSIFDRDIWGCSVTQEISELQTIENQMMAKKAQADAVQNNINALTQQFVQAEEKVNESMEAEKRAQEALQKAQEKLKQTQDQLNEASNVLSETENKAKKVFIERDRLLKHLTKKQEVVRSALRRKQARIVAAAGQDEQNIVSLDQLMKTREEERLLNQEYNRLTEKASILLARAHELKQRGEKLEKGEDV